LNLRPQHSLTWQVIQEKTLAVPLEQRIGVARVCLKAGCEEYVKHHEM